MELTIKIERNRTKEKINFSGKNVKELLTFLKINPETVILTRKNEILNQDDVLKNKDQIEILSVISGG